MNYLGRCLHKAVKFGLLLSYIPLYPVFYFIFKYFCILTKLSSEKPLDMVSASDQQHVDTLREKRDLQKRETYRKENIHSVGRNPERVYSLFRQQTGAHVHITFSKGGDTLAKTK